MVARTRCRALAPRIGRKTIAISAGVDPGTIATRKRKTRRNGRQPSTPKKIVIGTLVPLRVEVLGPRVGRAKAKRNEKSCIREKSETFRCVQISLGSTPVAFLAEPTANVGSMPVECKHGRGAPHLPKKATK